MSVRDNKSATKSGNEQSNRLLNAAGLHLMALAQEMMSTRRSGKVMLEVFFVKGEIEQPAQVQYKFAADN